LFGFTVSRDGAAFYYLCFALLIVVMLVALNILRAPTGRAFVAIRDSETAAKSLGINLAVYKVMAFSISAAMTGLAGCLYAHKLSFISPEMFTLLLSLEFIIVIIIGGIGSLHGAVLGSIFVVMVDPCLTLLKDDFPPMAAGLARALGASAGGASWLEETLARLGGAAGLKGAIYGVIIMLFIIFEPYGLYGRWLKMQHYFQLFPLYKKATFRRQKTYVKSERNR
jgi:branched-chain amino acid transport system permease protein